MSTIGKKRKLSTEKSKSRPMKKQKRQLTNLNDLRTHKGQIVNFAPKPLGGTCKTSAHFTDIEAHILQWIAASDVVIGAVAWLTSTRLLEALISSKKPCLFILQDETYVHGKTKIKWKKELAQRYRQLIPLQSLVLSQPLTSPISSAIRVIGSPSLLKKKSRNQQPLMHNKILVFGKLDMSRKRCEWFGVSTGSFNLTAAATRSLENVIYIEQSTIINAYLKEWTQLLYMSRSI